MRRGIAIGRDRILSRQQHGSVECQQRPERVVARFSSLTRQLDRLADEPFIDLGQVHRSSHQSIIPIISLPLPERADGLDGQAVTCLARHHHDLTTVMRLVRHEIGQHVRHVKREIPPYVTIRRRDGAICREPQLEESLDAGAAPLQRGDELPGRHAVVIHAGRSGDAMLTPQRFDPPTSGIVKVRRNRANRTLRRSGNSDIPKRTRQMLDEL